MSTRQNKKRKGRNNVNNRERTVTTLTEDPHTSFLVPTTSEEPAGQNIMSSPFSVTSSSGGGPPSGNMSSQPTFPLSANFAYGAPNYPNYLSPQPSNNMGPPTMGPPGHHPQQQQHQQLFPKSNLPPGQSDLEVLQKLKDMIKSGQHEIYSAIPQPAALANIYLGPPNQSQIPHPEQIPSNFQTPGFASTPYDGPSPGNPIGNVGSSTAPASSAELGRRPSRRDPKDNWEVPGTRKTSGPPSNNPGQGSRFNTSSKGTKEHAPSPSNIKTGSDSRSNNDPMSAGPASPNLVAPPQRSGRFDQATDSSASVSRRPISQGSDAQKRQAIGDRPGEPGYTGKSSVEPLGKISLHDGKSEFRRDSLGAPRDGPPFDDEKRVRSNSDSRALPPFNRAAINSDPRPSISDIPGRGPPPKDQRFPDRERDRDRDRERDFDRDRDRDRRLDYRFRDERPRMTDMRRPPPEQRHYEPRYSDFHPRRLDSKPGLDPAPDRRPEPAPASARPGLVDDRSIRVSDDRVPPNRAAVLDVHAGPVSGSDNRRGPISDEHTSRPGGFSPADSVPVHISEKDHGVRASLLPSTSNEDRNAPSQVPLEDRIRAAPSLHDRLSQPPSATHPARNPTLEDRLSSHHPPSRAVVDHTTRPPPEDHLARPIHSPATAARAGPDDQGRNLADTARPIPPRGERPMHVDDRPGRPGGADRYVRPITPVQDRGPLSLRPSGYGSVPNSAPLTRDDSRSAKMSPSPTLSHRPDAREYRTGPVRELSRERVHPRPVGYRSDTDRSYNDDRRPDLTDADLPPRINDSRVPYRPPPVSDVTRDRSRSLYPPPSPPRSELAYDGEADRRYPPGERRDWPPFETFERRRDWTAEDDEYWKRRQWDRNNAERERFERDVPPRGNGWQTREEHERRTFRGQSPARSFDGAPPRPPLNSRIQDGYSNPVGDRAYPPRDLERSRYPPSGDNPPPPFSRIRPRSPSPVGSVGRRPPSGNTDDPRPPMKRAREEAPYPSGYYSPPLPVRDRREPTSAPSSEYPRPLTPPPNQGARYYDARSGPPIPSSGPSAPHEREYPGGRQRGPETSGYPYDRSVPPRSPPPPRVPPPGYDRGPYGRDGDPRDDRRYTMPPPRTA